MPLIHAIDTGLLYLLFIPLMLVIFGHTFCLTIDYPVAHTFGHKFFDPKIASTNAFTIASPIGLRGA